MSGMTDRGVEALAVPYDPKPADERMARRRSQFRMRLISLGITVVIMIVIYLWQGRDLAGPGFFVIYALVFAIAVAWAVVYGVGYRMAKQERAGVGTGTALRIDRTGVELAGTFTPWAEVVALAVVGAGPFRAPQLQVSRSTGEPVSVALEAMDVRPATIDQTARAYSAGRHGVDLSQLDS